MGAAKINGDHGEDQARRTFTSRKLDWLNTLVSDPRITDRDIRVAVRIAEALNQKSGAAILSDRLLLDDIPTLSDRWQLNDTRKRLVDAGYADIETGRGNRGTRYRPHFDKVNNLLDRRLLSREKLEREREDRQASDRRRRPNVARPPHRSIVRGGDSTTLEVATAPPVHLKTPSQVSHGEEARSERVESSRLEVPTSSSVHPTDLEVAQANFDERAAILEHDGGWSRSQAEAMAREAMELLNEAVI